MNLDRLRADCPEPGEAMTAARIRGGSPIGFAPGAGTPRS
jgi:hypothetical protein